MHLPPIHPGARQHHRTSCRKHHRAGHRVFTIPHGNERAAGCLHAQRYWMAAISYGPGAHGSGFWQGPKDGGTSHSTGRGREGTNSTTDDEDCTPIRNTKSPHPKTRMLHINRKPKKGAVLTRIVGRGARCLANSQHVAPSPFARMWEGGRPETIRAWEARGGRPLDNGGGDRTAWMNVGGARVHARPVRPPLLCRNPGAGKQPARMRTSRYALLKRQPGP